ncbi:MAG: hypothetical protein K9M94_14450 [Spirochaetia bacterium]|nr:hypothetical protein [Spirochaetia bacterium]
MKRKILIEKPHFFSYKLNIRILLAFFLIIVIPSIVFFGVSRYLISRTVQKEINLRLRDGTTVYFEELESIEKTCKAVAAGYSKKKLIIEYIRDKNYNELEREMISFYKLGVVDILEIENTHGEVIFRGHNPEMAGDIKIDQQVVRDALAGKTSVSYEEGKSGVAVRATAPILNEGELIGILMAGSLFSQEFVNHLKALTLLENGIYRDNEKIISTYAGHDVLSTAMHERLSSGKSVELLNRKIDEKTYHMRVTPVFLQNSYWGAVLLGVEKDKIEKAYRYTNDLLNYIVLLGFFIAVLIYSFLARNINNSLKKIITGISSFSFDRPNEPIVIGRNDEFGIIAENYNLLIDRLELYKQRISRLQEDLVESTRLATAGQVAAGLAHEIRNPLSSIRMMAQIIRSRFLYPGKGAEEMAIILEEIDRINGRVSELLEFSRPSKLDLLYHDIHAIIDGVIKLSRYEREEQNIMLQTEFDKTVPAIYVDGEKIRIFILNIVLNAIQAMENGGTLSIATRGATDSVTIEICNSVGKEDVDPNMLFEPFYSTKAGGTGLGLSITKMIIERHGGSIGVDRRDNMVCFVIELPIHSSPKDIESNGHNSGSR